MLLAPVCRAWCKATDFAAKCPEQMQRLVSERAIQSKMMSDVATLIRIVLSYGGHIIIENPTHSKI